jgi:hypothetical protein
MAQSAELRSDRVVAIGQYGTGFLLGRSLVLTSDHILGPRADEIAVVQGNFDWVADPVWRDLKSDAALLRIADRDLAGLPLPVFGEMPSTSRGAGHEAEVRGFQRLLFPAMRPVRATGQVQALPEAGSAAFAFVPESLVPESDTGRIPESGTEPALAGWDGMSGAPVWVDGRFIGILTSVERDRPQGVLISYLLQDSAFAALVGPASEISPDAGLPAPPVSGERREWSRSVREVLAWAIGLAGPSPADASVVLLAALLYGRETSLPGMTSALLGSLARLSPGSGDPDGVLQRLARAIGVAITDRRASDSDVTSRAATAPLAALLTSAARIAEQVSGDGYVHLRHLVAAAILADDPPLRPRVLGDLGVSAADLRSLLRDAVVAETSGEPTESWFDLLPLSAQEPSESVAPSPEAEPEAAARLAGGIDTDRVDPMDGIPMERDHLDVGVWVSMLATAIVSGDTQMPLSVGIFGEWGAGKSYFMGLLQAEIERLAGSQDGYLRDVVPIGFNAWHYADTNLWASLGDEIFRQLAGPGQTPDERRRTLRDKIAEASDERKILERRQEHAREESQRLQSELDQASQRRDYRARDLLRALMSSETLGQELKTVWQRLGISDELEQARLLADEVRGGAEEATGLRRQVGRQLGRERTSILALVCVVAVLAIIAAAWVPARWGHWLGGGGAAALAVGLSVGVTWAAKARRALATLRRITAEASESLARSSQERAGKAVGAAVAGLRQAEADEKLARAELDELVTRVGQLTRELSDLMPSQRLYTFLAERAGSGLYAGHLGLISTIRKDFEHLVGLLRDWQAHDAGGADGRRRIDRIVLYIDDLDRCPADQVVKVLQAVHLLLALDLFVVVVGVDPRWLQRSLRDQYQDIFAPEEASGPEHALRAATPVDYLEKIFNLPIVLPGIPPQGLGRMLRGLVAADRGPAAAEAPEAPDTGGQDNAPAGPGPDDTDEAPQAESAATLPVEPGSQLAAGRSPEPGPPPRPLTEAELTMLGGLEPFVDTPRDAKRMLNLYRMLRSTRDLADASSFLGDGGPGEYEAVAMLLAMLTANARLLDEVVSAAPRENPRVAGGLHHRPADGTWAGFVTGLAPVEADGGWVNQVRGALPAAEVAAWLRFAAACEQTSPLITLPDLRCFQRWAPIVARFSFSLSARPRA